MLDCMTTEEVRESMELLKENNLRDRVLIEVSGNVTEENTSEYAELAGHNLAWNLDAFG